MPAPAVPAADAPDRPAARTNRPAHTARLARPARAAGRPTASTRERILATCQRLFNERGPVAVTTAEIAATVGINEGNLYYYFKTKEQMLQALFARFEAALHTLQTLPMPAADPAGPSARATAAAAGDANGTDEPAADNPYLRRQLAFFELVWTWRFLYRDALPLLALAPDLRQRLTAHAAGTQAELERTLRQMVADGLLQLPAAQIPALATNAWIVSTYWLHYLQFNRGVRRITRAHLLQGHEQVRMLYQPYLRARGRANPATTAPAAD